MSTTANHVPGAGLLGKHQMRVLLFILLIVPVASSCRNQPPASALGHRSTISTHGIAHYYDASDKIEVTCTPQYYRRAGDDALISATQASRDDDFAATGIVLRIESPKSEASRTFSLHFDFLEKWNHWYKPGRSYVGMIPTNIIGTMSFLCDPGLRELSSSIKLDRQP